MSALYLPMGRGLERLPSELRSEIASMLGCEDIGNLRLACTSYAGIFFPRVDRVFLSASSLDIQVLCAIADHDVVRRGVRELVWDEARFGNAMDLPRRPLAEGATAAQTASFSRAALGCEIPAWFTEEWQDIWTCFLAREGSRTVQDFHTRIINLFRDTLPIEECWRIYMALCFDQDNVLLNNTAVEAFRYALQRFPSLQRVTVSPAVHGCPFTPLYRTPRIKSFPCGFLYPIPRGWSYADLESQEPQYALAWTRVTPEHRRLFGRCADIDDYHSLWRGFCTVTRVLSGQNFPLRELSLSSQCFMTGINGEIFSEECPDYRQLCQILAAPGFRRFDLSVQLGNRQPDMFGNLKNGLLRNLLAQAPDMEHFSLQTNITTRGLSHALQHYSCEDWAQLLPILSVIPIERWHKLRHLSLNRLPICEDNLISFLGALPESVCSIELSALIFRYEEQHYSFLEKMKNQLNWRHRKLTKRPSVKFQVLVSTEDPAKYIEISEHVELYIYGNGGHPFNRDYPLDGMVKFDIGACIIDTLDPLYRSPWTQFGGFTEISEVPPPSVAERMEEIMEAKELPSRLKNLVREMDHLRRDLDGNETAGQYPYSSAT